MAPLRHSYSFGTPISTSALAETDRLAESEFGAPHDTQPGIAWRKLFRFTYEQADLEIGAPMNGNRPPLTKRQYLRELVYQKNQWSHPLTDEERTLGFLGWHERGYLPHCDFPGLVQFVTFRLADSIPASRRGEWEHLLKIEDVRERRTKLEEYLDLGVGECWLRDPRIAKLAEDALLFFHGQRYELLAWCVMPNHVHVLVHVWQTPLGKLVQSWKRHVASQAEAYLAERRSPTRRVSRDDNNAPVRRAALQTLRWEREYWDTFVRDEKQERKAIRYIENNPVKARLCRTAEDWPFGARGFGTNIGGWFWLGSCSRRSADFQIGVVGAAARQAEPEFGAPFAGRSAHGRGCALGSSPGTNASICAVRFSPVSFGASLSGLGMRCAAMPEVAWF